MEKQNRSSLIALICLFAFAGILLCLAFTAPMLTKWYIAATNRPSSLFMPVVVTFYTALPFACATIYALARLLLNIFYGQVFVRQNVRLLRAIAFLLAGAAVIFLVAGFWYFPFFLMMIAAAFVVLIVCVVKSCFEAAVVLKDENELTI